MPVKIGKLLVELFEAISHSEMLSTNEAKYMVSKGNASADFAAKQATKTRNDKLPVKEKNEEKAPTIDNIAALQEAVEASEKAKWEKIDCCFLCRNKTLGLIGG